MKKRTILWLIGLSLLLGSMAFLGGCSVSHETMRGSVVMKFDDEAHICIGSGDGAALGQFLNVYRIKVDGRTWLFDYQQRYPTAEVRPTKYEKIKVGEVKVIRIFDEHFAAVQLVSGELESSDIVERSP